LDGAVAIFWLIFLSGLALIIAEMFVPGAVMGAIGLVCVFGSIIYAIASGHSGHAAALVFLTIACIPVLFLMWKNVIGNLFSLKDDEGQFTTPTRVKQSLLHEEGTAVTPLRPSGIARIDGTRYDVVTRGEMVDSNSHIKVIHVAGNRVVVREVKPEEHA
jgi:membrane-bound serine protease (ClpP class)